MMSDKKHYREQIGELCTIYKDTLDRGHGVITRFEQGNRAAEKILAAGYRKPRTVTTEDERDAIKDGTIVRSSAGTTAHIFGGRAYFFETTTSTPAQVLALPLTVLWEPAVTE